MISYYDNILYHLPFKGIASLNVSELDPDHVDAIMASTSGRTRRAGSLRFAALMQSIKQEEDSQPGVRGGRHIEYYVL